MGSAELPVVGGNAPYAVVHDPEERAEYERGLAKMEAFFREREDEFWDSYARWALPRWREALREVSIREWEDGYAVLGLYLGGSLSVAAYRRDAEGRFKTDAERVALWRALNRYLVEQEFLWTPPEQWPVERWVRAYGRERVLWLLLNFPLPEELERHRTEKLSLAVPKRDGPQGILWERIGQLGSELERQRRRAAELSRLLFEERSLRAELERKLARLQEQLAGSRATGEPVRHPDDVARIRRLKSLVRELREEVVRLRAMLPAVAEEEREESPPEALLPAAEGGREEDYRSALRGAVVAVYGRLGEVAGICEVLWHDGDKWDHQAESAALRADVLVVLTRMCSHEVMWAAKEVAADRGVPCVFLRATGTESILREVAMVLAKKERRTEP